MCGDGANDCGALKAANTGISLSEAESSVASPLTAHEPNIGCVPTVIKEGRAALTTSFGVFKFMVAYSLTGFLSVIILYGIDANLTNWQFLFVDLCLVVNFASFFGKTEAFPGPLDKRPPMTSLLGFTPLFSLFVFMCVTVYFQYFSYYFIQGYDFFEPFVYDEARPLYFTSYENYAVYCTALFQYITMVVVFSQGKPYRRGLHTNVALLMSVVSMSCVCVYIVVCPAQWVVDVLEMKLPPVLEARLMVVVLAVCDFVVCLVLEELFVNVVVDKKVKPLFHSVERSRKKYLRVVKDMQRDNWPFVCDGGREVVSFVCEKGAGGESAMTKL